MQSLVRPFVIETGDEPIELRLLLKEVLGRRLSGLLLRGQMHPLVPAVLLRMARFDALDVDPQTQPPAYVLETRILVIQILPSTRSFSLRRCTQTAVLIRDPNAACRPYCVLSRIDLLLKLAFREFTFGKDLALERRMAKASPARKTASGFRSRKTAPDFVYRLLL